MAGKVVTTAAPTKQEAAAVRNYVGKTAKANPGTSRAVEKVGSDARNVNYYRGAADPESKKKKGEAREAAQRDRNLAARMEGNGQQTQYQQEAQQPQQEQAPETTFTDEANKGKGQAEQQEATRYTQEANADPARTLAETAEGKQNGSAWAKQRAEEASAELADLQADRLRVYQLYENGEPPSEQTLQALGLKHLEEYDDAIEKAEEQANYYEQLAREADGSKGFLEGLKERHNQQMENMSKQSDNWWEDPQASWAFLNGGNEVDDQVSGWAKQFASGPVQAVGTGLQWFDQSSDDMVRYEYDQEHGEGAYDRAIAGKNVNQVGQLGDKLWGVGTNLYESGQEDWERGTENLSDTGKTIANIAKTGMDVVGDAALNAFAPGLGTMRMYLGAAGNGSYEQSQRENNDIDSRAVAMVKNGLNAYLSNKLLGGLETVYGRSVLGGLTDDLLKSASPQVQKTLKVLLNTEGLEEGLEDILNWGGDIILGLDTGKPLDWDEVKQDAFIGYVLGVITNGLAGGMNIDSKKQQNIAREGVEFAEGVASGEISGIDEAAEIGKQNTSNNVTMKPGTDANVEAEAETSAPAAETQPEGPQLGAMDTGAQTEAHQWIRNTLSGGAVSEQDISRILSTAANRQAFADVTGISLEGKSFEEARNIVGQAASSVPKQNTRGPERYQRSDNETVATIQERGTISQREASRLLRDPAARAAFEEAYGVNLENKGETRATQEIIDAVNKQKTRERATGQYFEVPAAEPGNTEGPGEEGSRDRSEYERDVRRWQQAQDDVVRILTGEDLSRKDATRLMNDNGLWQAFEEATGIDLHGKPRTELNVREAVREAKQNPDVMGQIQENPADTLVNAAEGTQSQSGINSPANTQNAAEAGLNSPETSTDESQAKRGSGTVSFDGAVVDGRTYQAVDRTKLNAKQKAQVEVMERVAQATGINITFFQSQRNEQDRFTGANGMYKDGTVYLDVNAGLYALSDDGTHTVGEIAIVRTAAHELTHFIQQFNENDYNEIRDYVVGEVAKAKGVDGLEELIAQKLKRDSTGTLTRDGAIDEIIADGCEMMLKDSTAVEDLARENPSLAKRISQWIKDWVSKIKSAFEGVDAVHEEAKVMMRNAEQMQAMWDAALKNAAKNLKTEPSVNSGGVKINDNTADGGITVDTSPVVSAIRPQNGKPLIQYQARTELEALPKQIFSPTDGESRMLVDETGQNANLSVRDIRNAVARANGISEENISKVNEFLDQVEEKMKEYDLKYRFVGLQDIEDASILLDRDGNIVLSAMVKNDEYAVNFDFTKLCKKRQALQQVIEVLAREKGRASENGTTEVNLSPENVQRINEMLAASGVETNCLGCFVEAKRANQQQLNGYILEDWNKIIDEVAPDAGYFHFADADGEVNLHSGEKDQADFAKYREALSNRIAELKKQGKGITAAERARILIENVPAARKRLTYSDLATERGRTRLHQEFPEIESFAKARLGTASFKTVEAFTPYNAEVELLDQGSVKVENGKLVVKKDDGSLRKKLAKIGGARSQSFSDFIISHVYDVMQKTAAFASRGLPAHTYTKEISRASLFGKTGEKHNMSVLFEVDPDVDSWNAGLTKSGNYFVGDYQHFMMEEGQEGKAHFIQSIGFEDARKLQNTDGYSKNCGIIAVPLSYTAYKKALADPDIRMIIGYHSSGMPVEVKSKTHYDKAADYQGVQNTQKVVRLAKTNYAIPEGIPSYATPPSDVKPLKGKSKTLKSDMTFDIKGRFEELSAGKTGDARTAAAKQTLQEFLDFMNDNGLTAVTSKSEAGYGKFPLYEDVEKTRDPYLTADHYIEYCISKGELPLFWEFATDQNYYKQLYDFNMFDRLTYNSETGRHEDMPGREAYAPQEAVHLLDSNGELLVPKDFFGKLEKYTADYNYQMQKVSEVVPEVLEAFKKESGLQERDVLPESAYAEFDRAQAAKRGTTDTAGILADAATGNQAGNAEGSQNAGTDQGQRRANKRPIPRPGENTDTEYNALLRASGAIDKGEKPARDIPVPKMDKKGMKTGEGVRTVMEANATPEERIASLKAAVVNGNFGHVPVSNDTRSKNAAAKIARDGWSRSVADFLTAVDSGQADADTIALGAHLLNEAGNSPDCNGRTYIELAMAYSDAMTSAGQKLQAGRILKTLTPEGKLYGMEKTVEKINKEIRKANEKRKTEKQKAEIKLDPKLVEEYLGAETDNAREEARKKLVKNAADQVPNTFRDKFTALRYLNMLGNFKTQVRNVAGNVGMTLTQKAKNEMRSAIEGVVKATSGGKYERQYKGLYGKERFKAASADFVSDEDLKALAMGEKKYSDVAKQTQAEIMEAKKPFSDKNPIGKLLNLYNDATGKAMEVGDLIFVRANYADALAGYMNAHGITAADWKAMVADPKQAAAVDKARSFAIQQAQEATFRDTNGVSKFISTMDSRWEEKGTVGKVAQKILQGIVPFRKTPANVMVRMEEYSPLGIINTAVKGIQAAKGSADVSAVIDSAAKSLTGTGLTALGILLASMGKARTEDDDEDKERLAKLRGQQDYSIEIGGKSFTMDWLSPMSAPFFMGVEAWNLAQEGDFQVKDLMNVIMSVTNPMMEMSMLSGVNTALDNLSDFDGDNAAMSQFALNSAWSYLTQGISNTLLGQMEQFREKNRQTYYTDSDNPLLPTWMQKNLAKLGNKTPGKDFQAADYIDAWGRKQANDKNLAERAWNVFLNPGYVSKMDEKATAADAVIAELLEFGKTQKEKDQFPKVVPKTPSRSTTVNGKKLTPEEYETYAITKGQESLKAVTDLIESDVFKNMDKFGQAEAIAEAYKYAEFLAGTKIAKARGEEYTGTGSAAERYAAVMDMKDPVAVLTAKTAYDNAVQAGDWDAVDTLLDVVQSGKGKLSKEGMDYLISKDSKINYYTYLTDHGVPTKRAKAFEADLKELYTSEKRTDAKATDMIRVAGSGKYSNKEADAIMQYEREVSDERRERYQDQLAWNLEQAGKSELYTEAWSKIEAVEIGEMDSATFKKWVDRNVPIERRQAIKDIASNLAEDRHAAGKYVSSFYGAAREIGCTPEQALQFFEHIDTNYNGSYTKKEIRNAVKWAFGSGQNAKDVTAYLKERGIL